MKDHERKMLKAELEAIEMSYVHEIVPEKQARAREILGLLGVDLKPAVAVVVEVFSDAELWLRLNLPLLGVDGVSAIQRTSPLNLDGYTEYTDYEDNRAVRHCDLDDHIKALRLLCNEVGVTLFVGDIKSPLQLLDAGNWDVEVVDAYYQFVMLGKVIYG